MTTKKTTKKKHNDIPLKNIPERVERRTYTDEFKMAAVKRAQAGENRDAIAADLGIPGASVISTWLKRVEQGKPITVRNIAKPGMNKPTDMAGEVRRSLDAAIKARDERLEVAATIAEADVGGKDGEAMAKKLRALKRTK